MMGHGASMKDVSALIRAWALERSSSRHSDRQRCRDGIRDRPARHGNTPRLVRASRRVAMTESFAETRSTDCEARLSGATDMNDCTNCLDRIGVVLGQMALDAAVVHHPEQKPGCDR